jgi:putative flippase GtrA
LHALLFLINKAFVFKKESRVTLESFRKKLLKKLNVKNSIGLAMYAVKYKRV